MTQEQKQRVAVFRFGIIHEMVGGTRLNNGERARLLREKCACKWEIPCSNQSRVSRSTILRWVRLYLESGGKLDALYPQGRNDNGQSRVLDQETGLALAQLRSQLPKLTVTDLVKQMQERCLITDGASLSLSTAYRFLHRHNLMAKETAVAVDRRKFEAELPNDLWHYAVFRIMPCSELCRVEQGNTVKTS
jgi:putative transposase